MGLGIKMGEAQNNAEITEVSDLILITSLLPHPTAVSRQPKHQLQAQSRNQAAG